MYGVSGGGGGGGGGSQGGLGISTSTINGGGGGGGGGGNSNGPSPLSPHFSGPASLPTPTTAKTSSPLKRELVDHHQYQQNQYSGGGGTGKSYSMSSSGGSSTEEINNPSMMNYDPSLHQTSVSYSSTAKKNSLTPTLGTSTTTMAGGGGVGGLFTCICGKECSTLSQLKNHAKMHAPRERNFACATCAKVNQREEEEREG